MTFARGLSLRERQRSVIQQCLSPTIQMVYGPESSAAALPPWQILVLDVTTQEIISSLFVPAAGELRRLGVTLQTVIDAPRDRIGDALAVYLISPTPENVALLLRDLQGRNLYDRFSIIFAGSAPRALIAGLAAQLSAPTPIHQVVDLHANFISHSQNFFSLAIPNSYYRSKTLALAQDSVRRKHDYTDSVAEGLLSVFVTLELVPIIRAQPGGPAAAVGHALNTLFRENLHLFRRNNSSTWSSFRRPILLLLDRDIDLAPMLHHSWTYQALMHDSLQTKANAVIIPSTGAQYIIDQDKDPFWTQNSGAPFPDVAQSIEEALANYRNDVDAINRKSRNDRPGGSQPPSHGVSTKALASAVASLPELTERKKFIDIHVNIATALLDAISSRALDSFFDLERQIIEHAHTPGGGVSAADYKSPLLELLRGVQDAAPDEQKGTGNSLDKLRLFLLFYLVFGAELTEQEVAEYRGILSRAGAPLAAFDYVRSLCSYRHDLVSLSSSRVSESSVGSNRALISGFMSSVVSRGYRGIASVAHNAKKIIRAKQSSMVCASILSIFMDERSRMSQAEAASDVLDRYLIFDPKKHSEGEEVSLETARTMLFSDAVLFVVGGGSCVEYDDLTALVKSFPERDEPRNLIYGTTERLDARQFVKQLTLLGET